MAPISGHITVNPLVLNHSSANSTMRLCLQKLAPSSWQVQLASFSEGVTHTTNRVVTKLLISTDNERQIVQFDHSGERHDMPLDLPCSARAREIHILKAVQSYNEHITILGHNATINLAQRIDALRENTLPTILGRRPHEGGGEPPAQRPRMSPSLEVLLLTGAVVTGVLGLTFIPLSGHNQTLGSPGSNPVTRNGLNVIPAPLLRYLAERRRLSAIQSERISGLAIPITIRKEELKSNPLGVLHTLYEKLNRVSYATRLNVEFTDEEGDDFGGLGAQLITDLAQALIDPANMSKLKGVEFDEKGFPHLTSDEGKEVLTTLGYLMALCFKNDEYRIGPIFNPVFYATLKTITSGDYYWYKDLFLSLNRESKHLEQLRENAQDYAKDDPRVHAVIRIAIGMKKFCDWSKLIAAEDLQTTIEGAFSKEILKERLKFENETILGWLKKWIDESDEETVKKFLYKATGCTTIGTNVIEHVPHANTEQLPTFHTCFNIIDIPAYDSYATFKKKMDQAVTESDDSFLLA